MFPCIYLILNNVEFGFWEIILEFEGEPQLCGTTSKRVINYYHTGNNGLSNN